MSGIFDTTHVRRAFGRAAATYDAHAILQEEVQKRLQERLDDTSLSPQRILDIGSGTGRGTAMLRQRFPKAQTIALDLALPMLRAAKKQRTWLRPFSRLCADAEALPMVDASIDLLHSSLCLQWCGNLESAFEGFRRVMRPKGLLLFSTFGPQTLQELRAAFAEVDATPHVSGFLDIHQIGDALLAAGFRDPVLERDIFTLTYPSVRNLMHELRAIGATNADRHRARALTGKAHLQRVVDAYEAFLDGEGRFPATYEVVYAQAFAPEANQPRRAGGQDIASFSVDQLRGSRRAKR